MVDSRVRGRVSTQARGQSVPLERTQAGLPRRLVCLHGAPEPTHLDALAQRLARVASLHVVAFGRSAGLAEDIERACAASRDPGVVLLGHGYGAALALLVASRMPVAKLVLVEPLPLWLLRGEQAAEARPARALVSRLLELGDAAEPEAARLCAELLEGHDAAPLSRRFAELAMHDGARLDTVAVRTVVVRGANSPWLTRFLAARLARDLPDAQLFEVASAGHAMTFTHSGELAFVLRRAVFASLELA